MQQISSQKDDIDLKSCQDIVQPIYKSNSAIQNMLKRISEDEQEIENIEHKYATFADSLYDFKKDILRKLIRCKFERTEMKYLNEVIIFSL